MKKYLVKAVKKTAALRWMCFGSWLANMGHEGFTISRLLGTIIAYVIVLIIWIALDYIGKYIKNNNQK